MVGLVAFCWRIVDFGCRDFHILATKYEFLVNNKIYDILKIFKMQTKYAKINRVDLVCVRARACMHVCECEEELELGAGVVVVISAEIPISTNKCLDT
jgi:hypothetical protein